MWLTKWFSRNPSPGTGSCASAPVLPPSPQSYPEYKHLLQEYNKERNEVILLGQQVGSLKFNYDQFLALQVEAAQIGKFVEMAYKKEIEAGEHARFKNLADMVIYYLSQERKLEDLQPVKVMVAGEGPVLLSEVLSRLRAAQYKEPTRQKEEE